LNKIVTELDKNLKRLHLQLNVISMNRNHIAKASDFNLF